MKAVFEVKRRKTSVTQGVAVVYLNGVEIADFADEYAIDGLYGDVFYPNADGKPQWGSVKPDDTFILAVLFPDGFRRRYYPEGVEEMETKIKKILRGEL